MLCSLDGLHPSDLTQWISMAPDSAIAHLYGQGTFYSGYTVAQAPADSFPGIIAPTTGARRSPATRDRSRVHPYSTLQSKQLCQTFWIRHKHVLDPHASALIRPA